MKKMITQTAVALGAAALLLPAIAVGQTAEAWQFEAAIYGYLPTIGGKTTFPQTGAGSDVTVDPAKVLESLNFAFMGSFGVRRGPWGAFTDVIYLDLGNSKSATGDLSIGGTPLPADASANLKFDVKGTVWTLAGSYRVFDDATSPVDVFAGARLLDLKQKLDWQLSGNIGPIPLPGRAGSQEVSVSNWDALIGVKGRVALGAERRWFLPYYLDIGTGNSDMTWQAVGGVGYAFGWGEVVGAWRYLDYRTGSSKIESVSFSGPAVAAVFHW